MSQKWKLLMNKGGLGYSQHVAGVVPDPEVSVKLQTLVCGRKLQRQDTLPRMHQHPFSFREPLNLKSRLCQD